MSNKRTLLLASNPKMRYISVCGWEENERRLEVMIRGRLEIFEGKRRENRGRQLYEVVQKAMSPTVVEDVASEVALNTFVVLIQRD